MEFYYSLLLKTKVHIVRLFLAVCIFILGGANELKAQITVTSGQTASTLAQYLVGNGVVMLNPTLTCPSRANGIFVTITSNLGLDSGVVLTNGVANSNSTLIGTNSAASAFASNDNQVGGDNDLNSLSSQTTQDACILEFDFIPAGDTIKFDYVFGSEEYTSFTCTQYNDVFGFFISGPGYPVKKNIALVPNTNIPVCINSVNNAGPSHPGYVAYCQAVGPGSPFNAYYRVNTTSTTVTYDGITTVMTAIAAVTPCDTYHLKLGVADAVDHILDSGVWLKAGSLNSVNTTVFSVGGGGLRTPVNYCVRGCEPGQFVFRRPVAKPTPLTIHFQIAGTALNSSDYAFIPDSAVILAGDTQVVVNIQGLSEPVPLGPKTVELFIYSPYACAGTTPMIIDSSLMTIYDSLVVQILNNDTAICLYDSIQLHVFTDTILGIQWIPATGLSDPFSRNPWAKPLQTTTYQVVANMPLSGCFPSHDSLRITINVSPTVNVGGDTTICLGMVMPYNAVVTPSNQVYTYSWSPATYLSATNIPNPISTPTAVGVTQYVIKVSPTAIGCDGYDTIKLTVLPNDFTLLNQDTAICKGATVNVRVNGDNNFTYSWLPWAGVSNTNIKSPVISTDTTRTYTITGTFPGCPVMSHSFTIDVQPNPIVKIGYDRAMCEWDTLQIHSEVLPGWYSHYSYSWTPDTQLVQNFTQNVIFNGHTSHELVLNVTTPAGCKGADSVFITVHPGNFGSLLTFTDTAICPVANPIQILAAGGISYQWTPPYFINNSNTASPSVDPAANIVYTGLLTDQYGCHDTLSVNIKVHPRAVIEMPDSARIYPGESYQINTIGNCLQFSWTPANSGLSSDSVSNPYAQPDVTTTYIATGRTENGCIATDTIIINVSTETLLDLPNAFVPGSGPNGELKIIKRGIATLKYFRIFNRWGQEVFSTNSIDDGWDGRYNGSSQPMGVYVYMIEAYTSTGKRFYKQGNITLIR
jgi:gliding motility-associated-like protein